MNKADKKMQSFLENRQKTIRNATIKRLFHEIPRIQKDRPLVLFTPRSSIEFVKKQLKSNVQCKCVDFQFDYGKWTDWRAYKLWIK